MSKTFWQRYGLYFVLIAAVFAAYANVYENWFLYDDEFLIQKNSLLQNWGDFFTHFRTSSTGGSSGTDSFYRPIQGVLYLITYQFFGFSEPAFHFLNVLFHALNAVLIFILGQRLGFKEKWSWGAALLWSLLPLHTEAVTYMSATADPTYTFFCLLGLIFLLPTFSLKKTLLAGLFFVLALCSKESAIVFPALALACLWVFPKERADKKIYLRMLIFWGIALAYLIARKTVLNFDDTFQFYKSANIYTESIAVRIYTFFATLPAYFKLILWPDVLSIDRSFSVFTEFFFLPVLLGATLLALALAQLGWGRGKRGVALSWGILWFLAAHSPHMGILIPVNSFFLEHWMYLPSIGLFLGFAQSFSKITEGKPLARKMTAALVAVIALGWGARTFVQNRIWETPITLYSHILSINPNSERVYNNLAMAYSAQGQNEKAIENYNQAIALGDSYAQTRYNLALLLLDRQQTQDGIAHLERAIQINPRFFQAYEVLAQVYGFQKNPEKEKANREKAEEIKRSLIR